MPAVSIAGGVVCLLVAVFLWYLTTNGVARLIVLALTATASAAMSSGGVGQVVRQGAHTADTALANLAGQFTGVVVSGLLGLVALGLVIHGCVRGVGKLTLAAGLALPVLVYTIPGPVGDVLANLMGFLVGALSTAIGALFGLG